MSAHWADLQAWDNVEKDAEINLAEYGISNDRNGEPKNKPSFLTKTEENTETDNLQGLPVGDPEKLRYGLIGDIAFAAAEGQEISEISASLAAMSWISSIVGDNIFLSIGNQEHSCNIYTLHIGRSGRGGKGESLAFIKRIQRRLEKKYRKNHADLLGQKPHFGGLSSREGLAYALRDPEVGEDPEIFYKSCQTILKSQLRVPWDKRYWVVEAEFSNVLAQGKRDTNTLLSALRDCWDGGDIKPLTKISITHCSDPHISLHGNITPAELLAKLDSKEVFGGTLNRFLLCWAERTGFVPFPKPSPDCLVDSFARLVFEIVQWAYSPPDIDAEENKYRHTREARLSPQAESLYKHLYRDLRSVKGGEFLSATLERMAPITLRVALLFAICDKTLVISEKHVQAGYEWAKYSEETARYIFREKERKIVPWVREKGNKLLSWLRKQPGQESDRRTITNICFQKNINSAQLNEVLAPLLEAGRLVRREEPPRAGGRKKAVYTLVGTDNTDIDG